MTERRLAHERARFVEDLLSYMTLDEKLGQLNLLHPCDDPALEQGIAEGRIGGVLGSVSPARLQILAMERSRLGIPLLLAQPPAGLPISPWALAASWDEGLAQTLGTWIADDVAGHGSNSVAAPSVTDAAGATLAATHIAADEPHLAARLASAFVRGAIGEGANIDCPILAIPAWRDGRDHNGLAWSIGLVTAEGAVAVDFPGLDQTTAQRLGFSGLLLGECRRIFDLVNSQFENTRAQSVPEAAERAIAVGLLQDAEIDMAVRGVLGAKHAAGLFRDPERRPARSRSAESEASDAETFRKTFVLLRNEAGILPFSPVSDKVLVVGAADGPARACSDALDRAGIGNSMAPGLAQRREDEPPGVPNAGDTFALSLTRDAARRADFAVVVLDDSHFAPPAQGTWPRPNAATMAMLGGLAPAGTRLVAILATAGLVDLAEADQYFSAVLQSWAVGEGYVAALSDVLSGRFSPQGRMPANAGRFLFGHGLGFGESVVSGITLTPGPCAIVATANVRNAGAFAMRETVQVYTRAEGDKPRLVGFTHVSLAPGEEETVTFELGIEALSVPTTANAFELAAGRYEIMVGKSVARLITTSINISPTLARGIILGNDSPLRLVSG